MDEAEGAFPATVRLMRQFNSSLERAQQSFEAVEERLAALRADAAPEVAPNDEVWIQGVPARLRETVGGMEVRIETAAEDEGECQCPTCCADRGTPGRVARALLREHLTERQLAEYEEDGRFNVVSQGGRTYNVGNGGVRALDGPLAGARFCIQLFNYPSGDADLARKLLLEFDELEFLSVAVGGPFDLKLEVAEDLVARGLASPEALTEFREAWGPSQGEYAAGGFVIENAVFPDRVNAAPVRVVLGNTPINARVQIT